MGIMPTDAALEMAENADLDLVEVSPKAKPPVCRLMDYGKFKYQQSKRSHVARQNQKIVHLKEVKMKPKLKNMISNLSCGTRCAFLKMETKSKLV